MIDILLFILDRNSTVSEFEYFKVNMNNCFLFMPLILRAAVCLQHCRQQEEENDA